MHIEEPQASRYRITAVHPSLLRANHHIQFGAPLAKATFDEVFDQRTVLFYYLQAASGSEEFP